MPWRTSVRSPGQFGERGGETQWAWGRLKHRLRPMRGLHTDRNASVIIGGLTFLQDLRRGHHELATETPSPLRVAAAFTELASAI